jgi:hypothetical protein
MCFRNGSFKVGTLSFASESEAYSQLRRQVDAVAALFGLEVVQVRMITCSCKVVLRIEMSPHRRYCSTSWRSTSAY